MIRFILIVVLLSCGGCTTVGIGIAFTPSQAELHREVHCEKIDKNKSLCFYRNQAKSCAKDSKRFFEVKLSDGTFIKEPAPENACSLIT